MPPTGPAITDINLDSQDTDIDIVLRHARPWRRLARTGLYDSHIVTSDARSQTRTA